MFKCSSFKVQHVGLHFLFCKQIPFFTLFLGHGELSQSQNKALHVWFFFLWGDDGAAWCWYDRCLALFSTHPDHTNTDQWPKAYTLSSLMQLMLDVWVLLAASGIIHSYRVFHIYADLGLVYPRVFYKIPAATCPPWAPCWNPGTAAGGYDGTPRELSKAEWYYKLFGRIIVELTWVCLKMVHTPQNGCLKRADKLRGYPIFRLTHMGLVNGGSGEPSLCIHIVFFLGSQEATMRFSQPHDSRGAWNWDICPKNHWFPPKLLFSPVQLLSFWMSLGFPIFRTPHMNIGGQEFVAILRI